MAADAPVYNSAKHMGWKTAVALYLLAAFRLAAGPAEEFAGFKLDLPLTNRTSHAQGFFFDFQLRASACAWLRCAAVIFSATPSRFSMASASPLTAARLNHMCA